MKPCRALALLAIATVAASGCASMTRERCDGDAPGDPASDHDALLVKRLVRSLFMDDVAAFERLQPTETQYVTLAWRFGAERADRLLGFARDGAEVRRHFAALRKDLAARGVDPRTAARCTRRFQTEAADPRLYMIDVALGEGERAVHLSGTVLDSSGHASLVGPLGLGALSGLVHALFDLAEGFVSLMERHQRDPAAAEREGRAYLERHAARHRQLQAELGRAIEAGGEPDMAFVTALVERQMALAKRWSAVLEGHPELQALVDELGVSDGIGTVMPVTPDGPVPVVPDGGDGGEGAPEPAPRDTP